MVDYKVVFHVDEIEKWGLALANVTNLLAGMEHYTIKVKVVANSVAVRAFSKVVESRFAKIMSDLSKQGVRLVACNNALKNQNLDPGELLEFVEVVPAGVVELVRLQHQGYAYLKP